MTLIKTLTKFKAKLGLEDQLIDALNMKQYLTCLVFILFDRNFRDLP